MKILVSFDKPDRGFCKDLELALKAFYNEHHCPPKLYPIHISTPEESECPNIIMLTKDKALLSSRLRQEMIEEYESGKGCTIVE